MQSQGSSGLWGWDDSCDFLWCCHWHDVRCYKSIDARPRVHGGCDRCPRLGVPSGDAHSAAHRRTGRVVAAFVDVDASSTHRLDHRRWTDWPHSRRDNARGSTCLGTGTRIRDDLLARLVRQTGSCANRLRVQFQHVHLPKLAAHDILVLDAATNTVRAGENTNAADSLLDVVHDWATQQSK